MNDADQARQWIAHDPDERDRAELAAIVESAGGGDAHAQAELADRMGSRLVFGTAGLRGAIGAGPNRMNTAVVTTATVGLSAVLREDCGDGFLVVIGYDARHRSEEFARTAAGVLVAAGGRVALLPHQTPTPVLAFAVQHLGADAGIMITASHNPPADNGYKVYLGGRMVGASERGAQLVSPTDARVMAAIVAAGWADGVPNADEGWTVLGDEIEDAYAAAAAELLARLAIRTGERADLAGLRVVLTAMHGVGARLASRVLRAAGVSDLLLVAGQRDPDPDFPTVPFPNPEEPGALDMAIDLARRTQADLVVALDPDADRCSVAVPDATVETGWRQLSGDQLGAVLGEYFAIAYAGDSAAVLARSIVSSSLLERIAGRHGVGSAQTLTGFKWITRAAGIVYGYEEAIGYCLNPEVVRDKDGITAALIACQLAASGKLAGRSLLDTLDDLAVEHGLYATAPLSFRVADRALITAALATLAADPPKLLAGAPVIDFVDLGAGYLGLAPTEGYRFETDRGDRVVVRPSGTEPKLKCYLEVVTPVPDRARLPVAKADAEARLAQIKAELNDLLGLSQTRVLR